MKSLLDLFRFKRDLPREYGAYPEKIEVFSRHCIFSTISHKKKRLSGFSHEKCYRNLLETIDPSKANLTFFLDTAGKEKGSHYLDHEKIVFMNEGTEGGSFLFVLNYVLNLSLHPETICYFVEDDYIHREGWVKVLQEAFTIPGVDYVTLYDHKDKYFFSEYRSLQSQIFITPSCHWRTTPSTTQTFAVKFKTLQRDYEIHKKYSEGRKISLDHKKFLHLGRKGAVLVSSIPGWSTHAEPEYASPCIDWESFLNINMSVL